MIIKSQNGEELVDSTGHVFCIKESTDIELLSTKPITWKIGFIMKYSLFVLGEYSTKEKAKIAFKKLENALSWENKFFQMPIDDRITKGKTGSEKAIELERLTAKDFKEGIKKGIAER